MPRTRALTPRARRLLGVLLLARTTSAALTVVAGPPALVGRTVDAAPHVAPCDDDACRASRSRAAAELLLVEAHPNSCGEATFNAHAGALRGRFVLYAFASLNSCRSDSLAGAAEAAGAIGFATVNELVLPLMPTSGVGPWVEKHAEHNVTRHFPFFDVTSPAIAPVLAALRGGARVVADVAPSPDPWLELETSAGVLAFRVVLSVQLLVVLEMALVRLVAFHRADGGLGAGITLPRLQIALELLACGLRALHTTVDPMLLSRVLPSELSWLSFIASCTLPSIGTCIFLAFFSEAAVVNAGALTSSAPAPAARSRWQLLGVLLVAIAVDTAIGAYSVGLGRDVDSLRVIAVLPTLCLYPLVVALACAVVGARTRKSMRLLSVPPAVVERTCAYLRLALGWKLVLLALSPLVVVGLYHPLRRLVALSLLFFALSSEAMLRLRAYEPIGVALAVGPLERCARALALQPVRARVRARVRAVWSRQRSAQVVPRVSAASQASLPFAPEGRASRRSAADEARPLALSEKQNAKSEKLNALSVGSTSTLRTTTSESASFCTATPASQRARADAAADPASSRRGSRSRSTVRARIRQSVGQATAAEMAAAVALARASDETARTLAGSAPSRSSASPGAHLFLGLTLSELRVLAVEGEFGPETTTCEAGLVFGAAVGPHSSLCEALLAEANERAAGSSRNGSSPCVAPATLFVSHAQACSFLKMLDAIDLYMDNYGLDAKTTYLWLDIACIRQGDVAADVMHIAAIERTIGRVVMVLDPWDKPLCLTRVWCLYEVVHCTQSSGIAFDLTMAPSEQQLLWKALRLRRATDTDPSPIQAALASFDARNANATMLSDHWMIFQLIASSFAEPAPSSGPGAFKQALRSSLSAPDVAAAQLRTWAEEHAAAFDRFNALVRAALERALQAMSWQLGGMQPASALASVPRRHTVPNRQPGDRSPTAALSGRFDPAKRLPPIESGGVDASLRAHVDAFLHRRGSTSGGADASLRAHADAFLHRRGSTSGAYERKAAQPSAAEPVRWRSGSFDYRGPRVSIEAVRSRMLALPRGSAGEQPIAHGVPVLSKIDSVVDPGWASTPSQLTIEVDADSARPDSAAVDEPAGPAHDDGDSR